MAKKEIKQKFLILRVDSDTMDAIENGPTSSVPRTDNCNGSSVKHCKMEGYRKEKTKTESNGKQRDLAYCFLHSRMASAYGQDINQVNGRKPEN